MSTAKFKEAAQPYVETFEPELTVVSAHNGRLENYMELKGKLKGHVFESEKVGLVDSEVISHYFGALLNEVEDVDQAVHEFLCSLKGSNSVALLQVGSENAFLHLVHNGKTRGLAVWANEKNEVIFCSRPEPVIKELNETLITGEFKEKAFIRWREDASLKLSFPVALG
jgi:glucosamine 6-phosphate synthetase-like amidotransferase/phosphosugar isomerase protein